MSRLISIVFLLLLSNVAMAKWNVDSLYKCLDQAIEQSPEFIKQRESRIDKLIVQWKKCRTKQDKYKCGFALFKEYQAFQNDSAVAYLNRCVDLVQQMGDEVKEGNAKALLAFQCSTTGDYTESYSLLNEIDTLKLNYEGKCNYLWASLHLYGELAYYANVPKLRKYYSLKAQETRLLIERNFQHTDDRYLQMLEVDARDKKDFKKALALNDKRMSFVKMDSHEYAIVAYYRAVTYKNQKDDNSARYYFLKSALCDARQAVMDQGSMWELANLLNQDAEQFQRSYAYIQFAWEAAKTFNTPIRSRQIMPVLSFMEETYKNEITQNNKQLKLMIILSAFLLIFILMLLFYVNKQRNRLALAHQNLAEANKRLAQSNEALKLSNENLRQSNECLQNAYASLNESNKMKEVYIGRFLHLCAVYVDKIETMRKRVVKLVKARELTKLIDQMQLDHEYVSELYDNFDSAFLKLFPNFVNEFNALLKPEERIILEDDNKLTTTIRIFALIRLGIEDSSKIAEFLHYSVNTIYNYRAKVKNGALCDRGVFEEKVKEIGMK